MDEDAQARKFYFTPIQRVLALLILALLVSLVVVVLRVKPRSDKIWEWRFPDQNANFIGSSVLEGPIESMLQVTETNASNVFRFYRQNLNLSPLGGPMFIMRSRGLFSRRNFEETGVVPAVSTTNWRSEMFLNIRRGQSKIMLASQFVGDTNTAIWFSMVESRGSIPPPLMPFLFAIEYPGSSRASGGSVRDATAYAYTVKTNITAIESFYLGAFRTNFVSFVQSNALRALGDSDAKLFPLSSPPRVPTNEIAFILLTTRTMSLIHAAETGSNSVRMSIGVVTR